MKRAKLSPDALALRGACATDPTDFDARLVYADALDDDGDSEGATFQRRLVWFAQAIRACVKTRQPTDDLFPRGHYTRAVKVHEFRANVRVSVVCVRDGEDINETLYAWVRRSDGAVFRGSWKSPDKVVRFTIYDSDVLVLPHLTPFGLAYLG
jgi:uncharacterized protein (TIGR02996 family)